MPFDRTTLASSMAALARAGVYVGTSSWKYPGWCGTLYDPMRYEWRGRFIDSRFERNCLAEYATVFPTVCVDAAYYAFPTRRNLEGLAAQVPDGFQFAFKVTDEITVKRYPNLERYGVRAGKWNEHFLNLDVFQSSFLEPCRGIRSRIGLLIFEFSRFDSAEYAQGRDFIADLGRFLGELPSDWPYAVEIRNRAWLQPEYFGCLAARGVTHVFNSWEAMPPVTEQLAIPGSRTHPARVAARFLLQPGRKYGQAVKQFAPYDQVREVCPEAREAGRALIREGKAVPGRKTYLYVNNRLEGNALETIRAMVLE